MPYIYPTSSEFKQIEPELVRRSAEGRVGLEIMPFENSNHHKVRWSQKDNYYGLQHLRGVDGAPTRIGRIGSKTFEYEPGVFGEYSEITEQELLTRAQNVDVLTQPVDVDDLISEIDTDLIGRELDRVESSIWTLLTTGTLSIKLDGPDGTQTGWSDTFPIQTVTATVPWTTTATAHPVLDFQTVQQLGVGRGVDLGSGAVAYMNSTTQYVLLNNANSGDYAGRRVDGGITINTLSAVNTYLAAQGLPTCRIYDEGYIPTKGASFTRYIPTGKVVIIGKRPSGAKVGVYKRTRNVNAGYKPESYRFIKNYAEGINAEKRVPATIEVHRGHNGGPCIYYPSAIVVLTAYVP